MQHKPAIGYLSTRGYKSFFTYQSEAERDTSLASWLVTAATKDHVASLERCHITKPGFATPNRAEAITGIKAFDDQCQGVMTGNVMANTFYSSYIRPRRERDCNGARYEVGHLQNFDLRPFEREDSLQTRNPVGYIQNLKQADTVPMLLTSVFHWRRQGGHKVRVVHGAVLTTAALELVRTFSRNELGLNSLATSRQIMDAVTPLLCDQCAINRETVFTSPGVH